MRKKSPALWLIGVSTLLSSVTVISLMRMAGPFRSAVCVFFLLFILIGWLKIASFRRAQKERVSVAMRPPLSVTAKHVSKRIQAVSERSEKISA